MMHFRNYEFLQIVNHYQSFVIVNSNERLQKMLISAIDYECLNLRDFTTNDQKF